MQKKIKKDRGLWLWFVVWFFLIIIPNTYPSLDFDFDFDKCVATMASYTCKQHHDGWRIQATWARIFPNQIIEYLNIITYTREVEYELVRK